MEEKMIMKSLALEDLKAEKDIGETKINRKEINMKIDKACEEVFKSIWEQVDPYLSFF